MSQKYGGDPRNEEMEGEAEKDVHVPGKKECKFSLSSDISSEGRGGWGHEGTWTVF